MTDPRPFVEVVRREFREHQGADGRVVQVNIIDHLACGHEIWFNPSQVKMGRPAYTVADRRRCDTCAGLNVPGRAVVR